MKQAKLEEIDLAKNGDTNLLIPDSGEPGCKERNCRHCKHWGSCYDKLFRQVFPDQYPPNQ